MSKITIPCIIYINWNILLLKLDYKCTYLITDFGINSWI